MRMNHKKNRVVSSRRIRSRRITASMSDTFRKDMIDNFRWFIDDLQDDLQDNEADYFTLKGSYIDGDDGIQFEIEPHIYGEGGDPLDTLTIDYDYTTDSLTAYCEANDDVVAEGAFFRDISFNCYNWLKETLIAMDAEIPDDFYD